MSVFKKILSKVSGSAEETLSAEELRVHSRYDLTQGYRIGIVNGNDLVPIRNLSYGGFSLDKKHFSPFKDQTSGVIQILDELHNIEFELVHEGENAAGFCFKHDKPDLLLFLRNKIEFLRMGSSAKIMDKKRMREPYNQEGWSCYHGDGPCDLHLKNDLEDPDGLMVFLVDGIYAQIQFKGKNLKTGFTDSTSSGQLNTIVRETNTPVNDVIKYAYLVVLGLLTERNDAVLKNYLHLLEKELQRQCSAA